MIQVLKLLQEHRHWIEQINEMLVDAFDEASPGEWLNEIKESFEPDRLSLVAINEENHAVGWIGGNRQYGGKVWELHPLITKKELRGRGIGSLLVRSFEEQVARLGGITVWLGTDDENNSTSISGTDLYQDITGNIKNIKNINQHPYEFYQKLGYSIVGVLPDANGYGKPDIFMAKRVSPI